MRGGGGSNASWIWSANCAADLELEAEELREQGPFRGGGPVRRPSRLRQHLAREGGRTPGLGLDPMGDPLQDFGYALRTLRKSPGFALTAILTLALGIGASTAVFTVVDSIVLEPLAYRDGGQLVVAWEHVKFMSPDPTGPNPRHADIWQKRMTSLSGMALIRQGAGGLTLGTGTPATDRDRHRVCQSVRCPSGHSPARPHLPPGGRRRRARSRRHTDLCPVAKRLPRRPERSRQDHPPGGHAP